MITGLAQGMMINMKDRYVDKMMGAGKGWAKVEGSSFLTKKLQEVNATSDVARPDSMLAPAQWTIIFLLPYT